MSSAVAAAVADRYRALMARVDAACRAAGRPEGTVTLVGASKRQPVERMRAAWEAGLRVFGENQVQEAETKRAELPEVTEWHLLGPLQSNKAKRAARLFSTVHSVDRLKIGRLLDREASRLGKRIDGFLEVNLAAEPSKHGFEPAALGGAAGELARLDHLRIVGLMAIPPYEEDLERARGWFRRLRELRDELGAAPALEDWPGWLSMGMSHDFEAAIREGASHVRIGTDLFGARP